MAVLVEAVRVWPNDPTRDPRGWLVTVAWRKFLDAARAESSRRGRELAVRAEPAAGPVPATDDTLWLYFLCAHPCLPPGSAVALTLRAVGGLTTRQIALDYFAKRESSSGGRQMPSHYSSRKLNIWSVPTPTAAQLLPACGIAWGLQMDRKAGVVVTTLGDASTRQGDFYEAI